MRNKLILNWLNLLVHFGSEQETKKVKMAKHVIKVESVPEEQIDITSAEVVPDASNEIEDPDATEYSSSFADTISDAENGSEGNGDEVQSELFGENGMACPQDPFGPDVPTR